MDINKRSPHDELVSCEVCMKEIPVSEAKSEEATDYVVYYFGLDCYSAWKEQFTSGKITS